MKLSCIMEQGKDLATHLNSSFCTEIYVNSLSLTDHNPTLPLGMPALSIVATTASSVALILLLVVLFVLLQPKIKSLHR